MSSPAPTPAPSSAPPTFSQLCEMITLVDARPDLYPPEVDALCDCAGRYGVAFVGVHPHLVPSVTERLSGSAIGVIAVLGVGQASDDQRLISEYAYTDLCALCEAGVTRFVLELEVFTDMLAALERVTEAPMERAYDAYRTGRDGRHRW